MIQYIVWSLRDQEVACSVSYRQGIHFILFSERSLSFIHSGIF